MASSLPLPTALCEPRPRPLFCVVADAYRDRGIADAVCRGRFELLGVAVERPLPPDWLAEDLPADEEWRIAWHKFYYGLDLAHAFADSGDPRYLTTWRSLVLSFLEQVPLGTLPADVAGRRLQNWIYAWDRFAAAPGFAGLGVDTAERLLQGLFAEAEWLREHLTPERNHRTLELTALFNLAVAFPACDGDGALLAFALSELSANLLLDMLRDGVHRERSTHYHLIALRNFLGVRENCRRFAITPPEGFDQRLERACTFALHCHRPDGGIPAFSDADSGSYLDLLALAADLFQRRDFRFAATGGRRGQRPRETCPSFALGGYYVQRSDWGTASRPLREARYLLFDCGPIGDGGHGHYDALHFELAAAGEALLVDPGRYTYEVGAPDWRHRFKGTAAHNTVLVDDLDQTPYRPGKPAPGSAARARLRRRASAPGLDLLVGEVSSTAYEARHRRRLLFVGGAYWIVEDRLRGEHAHSFALRYHLAPAAQGRVVLLPDASRGRYRILSPRLAMWLEGPGRLGLEDGWFAPAYGLKVPAPVVALRTPPARGADFLSLLVPTDDGRTVRKVEIERGDDATRMVIDFGLGDEHRGDGFRETVVWSADPDGDAAFALAAWKLRARAGWLRTSAAGAVLALGACGVSELAVGGRCQRFRQRRALSWDGARGRVIVHRAGSFPEQPIASRVASGGLAPADARAGGVRQVESPGGEPAVVLLHGWGFDLDWWRPQMRALRAAGRRALAFDLRGLGAAGGGDQRYAFARLLDDLTALLRARSIVRPVLCGHALGALVALAYAIEPRDPVAGLVLVEARLGPRAERQARAEDFAAQLDRHGLAGGVAAIEMRLFSPAFRRARPEVVEGWQQRFLASSAAGLCHALEAVAGCELGGTLDAALPTLCVDGVRSPDGFEGLAQALAGARRVVLEGAAQLPQIEQAEAFNALLADFLARLPAAC